MPYLLTTIFTLHSLIFIENEEFPEALLESVDFEFDFCPRSYPLSRW